MSSVTAVVYFFTAVAFFTLGCFLTSVWVFAVSRVFLGETLLSIYGLGKHASGALYRQPSKYLQSTSFTMI